jgi:hypothetical protein
VATVCLFGTLEDKLAVAAAVGSEGVETFEPDAEIGMRRAGHRRPAGHDPIDAARS